MIFPSWLGFCPLFCILFMSCISSHSIMRIASACFHKTCIHLLVAASSSPLLTFLGPTILLLPDRLTLFAHYPKPSRASESCPEPDPGSRHRWIWIIPKHLYNIFGILFGRP